MSNNSLNISQDVLDEMYCNNCKSTGARIVITTDYSEADINEWNWEDDEWEIVVCSKCGWQELDFNDDTEI